LLGLFALVTLMAHQHTRRRKLPIRQAAWYHMPLPTFSDALALVRRQIWQHGCFPVVASPFEELSEGLAASGDSVDAGRRVRQALSAKYDIQVVGPPRQAANGV
jgi:hypothetical protein